MVEIQCFDRTRNTDWSRYNVLTEPDMLIGRVSDREVVHMPIFSVSKGICWKIFWHISYKICFLTANQSRELTAPNDKYFAVDNSSTISMSEAPQWICLSFIHMLTHSLTFFYVLDNSKLISFCSINCFYTKFVYVYACSASSRIRYADFLIFSCLYVFLYFNLCMRIFLLGFIFITFYGIKF